MELGKIGVASAANHHYVMSGLRKRCRESLGDSASPYEADPRKRIICVHDLSPVRCLTLGFHGRPDAFDSAEKALTVIYATASPLMYLDEILHLVAYRNYIAKKIV